MAVIETQSKVHWTYFVALERDLETLARYIEFAEANMGTFSLELAHLLMAASSEVDVVAKLLCERLAPDEPRRNIDNYRAALTQALPDLIEMRIAVPRHGLCLQPWINWREDRNPDWWRSYNNVKHERHVYFQQATLKNALNSMAALHCVVFQLYQLDIPTDPRGDRAKETTRGLLPDSSFMRLDGDFYFESVYI